jgi:hypothetical protein
LLFKKEILPLPDTSHLLVARNISPKHHETINLLLEKAKLYEEKNR